MLPLSRCPSFFLGVQVFKVLGHSRDVCGECGEKQSAHKPPVKRSGATRQGGVRDTKSTREKTSAGISPFLKFETSPLLRKKLQTGNIKTQVKPRGKVGVGWGGVGCGRAGAAPHWDGAHRAGPREHSRIQSFCLRGGFGEFLCLGTWRRAGRCFSCSSHPAQAPKCAGQISTAGHPGKSQSDRLAQSSQAAKPAGFNNCPKLFKKKKKKKKSQTNKKRS